MSNKMSLCGRKTSTAYEMYGFMPKVQNGKHTAICLSCHRELQNTAALRLQKHRNSCAVANASNGDSVNFTSSGIKRHPISKTDSIEQEETTHVTVKAEHCNMEFEDTIVNNEVHDNTYDTMEDSNSSKSSGELLANDEINNVSNESRKSEEPCNTLDQQTNSVISPSTVQQQAPEPFESYNSTVPVSNMSALDTDTEGDEVNDEDLINFEEIHNVKNAIPRSKKAKKLLDELSKAEAEYYRCKAAYFTKLTENSRIKKTLMLLESRKLQLEIEKFTNES